jgi:2,4'-dihydroxyacetophenone dioxygenase
MTKPIQFARTGAANVAATVNRKAFFDTTKLPWLDWVLPGVYFKLLNINPVSGGFTAMLKSDANNATAVHGHLGAVEGIILKGSFSYGEDDTGYAEHFIYESGGIRHEPFSLNDELVMFAIAHGPFVGYNDDGSIGGIVDARFMYELARAGGAADHIDKPVGWID